MQFSHVFIARPKMEAEELAGMLTPLGFQTVVQPAFDFEPVDASAKQPELLAELESGNPSQLLIFTSTRAVEFGLPQLPANLIGTARIAAIGPTTSQALKAAGVPVNVHPSSGFTSEALLATLLENNSGVATGRKSAVILAAPGGRRKMEEGLAGSDWMVQKLEVYRRLSADLNKIELNKLGEAEGVLSIWTSANALRSMAQRLPPATWFKICQGEWLVISERLKRLSRAYGPSDIHLSSGPRNYDLHSAVKALM